MVRRPTCNIPPKVQYGLRIVEFLFAVIALILFGIYTVQTLNGDRSPHQYVLSVIAGAMIWTTTGALAYCWNRRKGGDKEHRYSRKKLTTAVIIFIVVDLCFVVLFIAVAALTGPRGRGRGTGCRARSGRARGGDDSDSDSDSDDDEPRPSRRRGRGNCNLVKATFALSIAQIFSFTGNSILGLLQALQPPPNPATLVQGPANLANGPTNSAPVAGAANPYDGV